MTVMYSYALSGEKIIQTPLTFFNELTPGEGQSYLDFLNTAKEISLDLSKPKPYYKEGESEFHLEVYQIICAKIKEI